METFESEYGNLDNNSNDHSPRQDAHSPVQQGQPPLSLPFTNGCRCHSTHEPCSNKTEHNIDEDNDDQPINNRDSIKRQDVDCPINEDQPILLSCNNCKRSFFNRTN